MYVFSTDIRKTNIYSVCCSNSSYIPKLFLVTVVTVMLELGLMIGCGISYLFGAHLALKLLQFIFHPELYIVVFALHAVFLSKAT